MLEKNCSAVGIFGSHQDAEDAVKELQKSGSDMKKLSVVGKDYQNKADEARVHGQPMTQQPTLTA